MYPLADSPANSLAKSPVIHRSTSSFSNPSTGTSSGHPLALAYGLMGHPLGILRSSPGLSLIHSLNQISLMYPPNTLSISYLLPPTILFCEKKDDILKSFFIFPKITSFISGREIKKHFFGANGLKIK